MIQVRLFLNHVETIIYRFLFGKFAFFVPFNYEYAFNDRFFESEIW